MCRETKPVSNKNKASEDQLRSRIHSIILVTVKPTKFIVTKY